MFTKLEYGLELEFSELEYLKSGTLLISFETMLNCQKFCQNMVFGYFHRYIHALLSTYSSSGSLYIYIYIYIFVEFSE